VLGAPKTDRSVRDVDMVPTVPQVLESLRAARGSCFRGRKAAFSAATRCTMHSSERWKRRVFVGSGPTTYATRSLVF
jgi:hypothetical protein